MFFLVISLFYGFINLWIIWWFWRALQGTGFMQVGVCLAMLVLVLLFPLFYKMPGNTFLHTFLARAGALWTGIFFYLFILVFLADLLGLVARLAHFSLTPAKPFTATLFLGLCACIAMTGWFNAAHPIVREFDIAVSHQGPFPQNPGQKPFTIAAISDIHLGRILTAKRLEQAINLVLPHRPDLVLFLGDVLDDHFLLDLDAMGKAVAKLEPPLGVWGIAGNHEYLAGDIEKSRAILEACGIRILRDQWVLLENSLLLLGRDDRSKERFTGEPRKNLSSVLESIPEDLKNKPMILMDHQPYSLEKAEAAGIMLQLSGHTHNGQLWPFNWIVDKIYENPAGYLKRGETHYLVSAGAATWGPPMRTNSRPDVLIIRLNLENPEF